MADGEKRERTIQHLKAELKDLERLEALGKQRFTRGETAMVGSASALSFNRAVLALWDEIGEERAQMLLIDERMFTEQRVTGTKKTVPVIALVAVLRPVRLLLELLGEAEDPTPAE